MSDMAARCRSCGYEQPTEFSPCPVCAGVSGWWCHKCTEWRDTRRCAACGGFLVVPGVIDLGAFPANATVPVRFTIRNPGRTALDFSLSPDDLAVTLPIMRRSLRGGDSIEIHGTLALGDFPPGPRSYRVRIQAAASVETQLSVRVVAPLVRLEFTPAAVTFRNAIPGKTARRSFVVKNTGNVPVAAALRASESWLAVTPENVNLAPGGSATVKLVAKTRRTEHGARSGHIRVETGGGESWEVAVSVRLPEPVLEADGVDLGTVSPGRAAYRAVTLRNTGKVRVACTLASDQPWLAVTPRRVNLPPGGSKEIKLRARTTEDLEGPRAAAVAVTSEGRELLRIPVAAVCHLPRPALAPIRRQAVGSIANDAPVLRGFRIANTGDGRLAVRVTADVPWVEIVTPELKVGPGKRRRVEFRIHAPEVPRGKNHATIHVHSNGGGQEIPLDVTVVDPRPELEVMGDADLGMVGPREGSASGVLTVRNVGVGLLQLRAEPEDPRVAVAPESLTVAPGPPVKIGVSVAVGGLPGGAHSFGVRFGGNGGMGRAAVSFRLPVESVDVPSMIDLRDRAAGRTVGDAIRIRNTGPDAVTLRLLSDDDSLRTGTDQVTVQPGELVAVPFRLELRSGVYGPVGSTIRVEGRTVRHAVAVRAVARKVELVVIPQVLALGDMVAGEERAITLRVANNGDLPTEIRESHTPGELEVWLRRQSVEPGATAAVAGRVRMNAKGVGKQVRAVVPLAEETSARLTAMVAKPMMPRIAAGVSLGVGLAAGAALGATVGWFFGAAVMVAGVVAAGVLLAMAD